ncbi:dihydrodipicolinate synthase family protein, partial [Rhodoferax sp.]|uniref:dihydrodipicolinate synthase family protein n=1 Tax=Rhodoferax sp. TaxID=50421 RepID=UPI00274CB6FD|nr:dihydrodipicolinate synthase family protein [Rhodoferax sp.]
FLAQHVTLMMDAGSTGIVPLGSLGETATLSFEEKRAVLRTVVAAAAGRGAVVPGVAALATRDAVAFAQVAQAEGCHGLMVLPPYVYSTDWREMKAHVSAVIGATTLPCMLYNNPIAYKIDFNAEQMKELAEQHPNLVAVKESSADVRRIAAIKSVMGQRLHILVGVDDLIVEGIAAGATGWVAGLVNAFPNESIALFKLARAGRWAEAEPLYHWFLPLLRMDVVPKFVQLIKLVQSHVGMGSAAVRAPRLMLDGDELEQANTLITQALASKPVLPAC